MSVTVEPPLVDTPDAGVIEEARARQRRHRGLAAAGVIVASATASLLFGFAGGGGGSHSGSASLPAGRLPSKTARSSSASCGQAGELDGTPSRSLLSILSVLRRPATAADAGSGIAAQGFISGVFVHYIRLARVVDGSPYYVYPGIVGGCGTGETPHQGIMELARNVDLGHGLIGGTGGGGATAAAIEQGKDASSSGLPGSSTSSTVTLVVPDGVARVTLRYPAGRASGYSPKISPAFTVTTAPVENLVVVTLPRSNPLQQGTMIWRSADGRVIKTFDGLGR
jgi:hypothetical protein